MSCSSILRGVMICWLYAHMVRFYWGLVANLRGKSIGYCLVDGILVMLFRILCGVISFAFPWLW